MDAMTMKPVVAAPHTSIRDVAELMDKYDVGSVLIVVPKKRSSLLSKRDFELLGIVTEEDYVRRAVLEGHDFRNTPVSAIMTKDMVVVGPGMDILDALELIKDSDVRHLPVVDDGKLVGFLTLNDILKIQPHLFENYVDMIELREEHRKPVGKVRDAMIDDASEE